jgi:hypothetical protein
MQCLFPAQLLSALELKKKRKENKKNSMQCLFPATRANSSLSCPHEKRAQQAKHIEQRVRISREGYKMAVEGTGDRGVPGGGEDELPACLTPPLLLLPTGTGRRRPPPTPSHRHPQQVISLSLPPLLASLCLGFCAAVLGCLSPLPGG